MTDDKTNTLGDIWACTIGDADREALPLGADVPMRAAVREAFFALTGRWPTFVFSGWGAHLTDSQRAALRHQGR